MRVWITTFGCKVNQCDSASIAKMLSKEGHQLVERPEEADLIIINTCTVTSKADADARKAISRALNLSNKPKVVITGCYAELEAAQIAERWPEVMVVPNKGKPVLPRLLQRIPLSVLPTWESTLLDLPPAPLSQRSRLFLKVQEGCNRRCAYCIVPFVRGPERSLPIHKAVEAVQEAEAKGIGEVVICGTQLGAYRDPESRADLADLVTNMLRSTRWIMLRISSLEPWSLSEKLLHTLGSSPRIAQHLHLPLQSGSDKVLRLMGRPYTANRFSELVEKAKELIPDLTIGTDIMVGHPGEGEHEFLETLEVATKLPLDLAHVFTYSPRPGTRSSKLEAPPAAVAKKRSAVIRNLFSEKKKRWLQRHLGKRHIGVALHPTEDGMWRCLLSSYAQAIIKPTSELKPGKLVFVLPEGITGSGLKGRGEPLPQAPA